MNNVYYTMILYESKNNLQMRTDTGVPFVGGFSILLNADSQKKELIYIMCCIKAVYV